METESKSRKILEVGGSYLVSLPKEFIRENGLKPGDRLGLTYNSIIIIATPVVPPKEKK